MKHGDCARSALALAKAARFDEARPLLERAVTISEAVRGRDDVFTGMLLHDLVGIALETRDDRTGGAAPTPRTRHLRQSLGRGPPVFGHGAVANRGPAALRGAACAGRSAAAAGDAARSRARSAPSTPGLRRVSGRRRLFRYNARDLDAAEAALPPRDGDPGKGRRDRDHGVYGGPEQSRAGLHGQAGSGTSGGALPEGARAWPSGWKERRAITSACTCRTSASSHATAGSMRRRSSTRRAHWRFASESSAPNTSTSLQS